MLLETIMILFLQFSFAICLCRLEIPIKLVSEHPIDMRPKKDLQTKVLEEKVELMQTFSKGARGVEI